MAFFFFNFFIFFFFCRSYRKQGGGWGEIPTMRDFGLYFKERARREKENIHVIYSPWREYYSVYLPSHQHPPLSLSLSHSLSLCVSRQLDHAMSFIISTLTRWNCFSTLQPSSLPQAVHTHGSRRAALPKTLHPLAHVTVSANRILLT